MCRLMPIACFGQHRKLVERFIFEPLMKFFVKRRIAVRILAQFLELGFLILLNLLIRP